MSESALPKRKILLADDDVYIRRAYTFGLTKAGFEVINAADGKEVLAQAAATMPDIILLDQIMPLMDGFETLKTLKADPTLAHIPVILFTNLEQSSDIDKGRALGAADYLIKAEMTMKDVIAKIVMYIPA